MLNVRLIYSRCYFVRKRRIHPEIVRDLKLYFCSIIWTISFSFARVDIESKVYKSLLVSSSTFTHQISSGCNCIHNGCNMKLFQKLLKCYQILGILMPQSGQNYKQYTRMLLFLLSITQMFISSAAFFLFKANSMREYFKTLSVIVTVSVCVIYISICKWKMGEVLKLIQKFEGFIKKSELIERFSYFKWLKFIFIAKYRIAFGSKSRIHIHQIEWQDRTDLWIHLHCLGSVTVAWNIFAIPIWGIDQLLRAESKGWIILFAIFCDVIYHIFKCLTKYRIFTKYLNFFRLPFDWKTLPGYIITLFVQYTYTSVVCLSMYPTFCFFLGSCWLIKSFVNDITNELIDFNTIENRYKARQMFCKTMQNMSDVKQLSQILFMFFWKFSRFLYLFVDLSMNSMEFINSSLRTFFRGQFLTFAVRC